jgi:hypothetical protein
MQPRLGFTARPGVATLRRTPGFLFSSSQSGIRTGSSVSRETVLLLAAISPAGGATGLRYTNRSVDRIQPRKPFEVSIALAQAAYSGLNGGVGSAR